MSTLIFLIIAGLLVLGVAALLAWPLWRGAGGDSAARRRHAHAVKQLDRALQAGALDPEIHASQRRMLDAQLDAARSATGRPGGSRAQRVAAVAVLVAVPLLAAGLYEHVGSPQVIGLAPGSAAPGTPSVESMVGGLAARLQKNPDDLTGWTMLGRSYVVMGRYKDAVQAFARANKLGGDKDPEIQLDYAEAMALDNPDALTGAAAPLIEAALKQAPTNAKALWFGGLLAQAQQQAPLAVQRWNTLLAQPGLPDDFRKAVEEHIRAAGGTVAAASAGLPAAGGPAAGSTTSGTAGGGIDIKLSLAPALAAQVPAGAALFVYARHQGQTSGPPLAVRRLSAAALPTDVRLTSADAMIAGSPLNTGDALRIVARIALHGGVIAQPGDLQGTADYAGDGTAVDLRIDSVVH